jgi:hypothetical protein
MSITAEIKQNIFQVQENCNIEITITSSDELHLGDKIEIQFPNTWYVVTAPSFTRNIQAINPNEKHYIRAKAKSENVQFQIEILSNHLSYPEGPARHGRLIIAKIIDGYTPGNSQISIFYENTYAPNIVETESVWIQVKGKLPEMAPTLTVNPGPAVSKRIIIPSSVEPGDKFNALIVSLDKFDNCSSTRFENETLLLEDGEIIKRNISFVGSILIPIKLEKEGVYRIKLGNTLSNAIRVQKGITGPYWGDIHIHTKLSHDGQGTDPYKYAKDVSGLDFAAVTDHWNSLGESGYNQIVEWAEDALIPGEFVTIYADERNPEQFGGDHVIYVRDKEHFDLYAAKSGNSFFSNSTQQNFLQEIIDPTYAMFVPHHTGLSWRMLSAQKNLNRTIDLNTCDDFGLRPVMEIYSCHGQSEVWNSQHILSYEFNRMHNPERRSNVSVQGPYYAQNYWISGRKIGVIASSDNHSAQGGRRHGGIIAVFAKELTRESIFDTIRKKKCYATTGERILIDFTIDDLTMGSFGQKKMGKRLKIVLKIWGTANLLRVEILRYRFDYDSSFSTIVSEFPEPEAMNTSIRIEDELRSDSIYYARVVQEPLEWPDMAWTSPIWIDVI